MPYTVPRAGASQGGRPRWWTELPLIAVVYAAYSAGRLLARGDVQTAVDHGLSILRFEQSLHLDFETPLNDIFTKYASIGVPADFIYASLHYVATPALLVWLWKRRPQDYRLLRTWLLVSTLIGLVGFTLMPTCPPRLLDDAYGFVDTMAQYSSYGWWGSEASAPRGLGGFTNQFAAMPSLHVGWALWCGVALWWQGRSVWSKIVGVLYPLIITIVVMGTANHYFMDAAAGMAVMGIGFLLARPAMRLAERVLARFRDSGDATPGPGAKDAASGASASATPVGDGCETSPRERERIPRQQQRSGAAAEAGGHGESDAAAGPRGADDGAAAAAR
ncbi:phosphatase PAP2 family protein [Streptomyces sp. LX-29]|uniref:phosphatase PAP2 family protein n=1 Tax=Streptomyces sp. LX-29 TaxID=2900152 RepID=UPI00240E8852|nr:phosphatase PAP2 family protein [Streptomyces sp. LX-29]WFB09378.1 phosphatase PAP2 family protein [Streptomyces sp. LX-29]